MAKPALSATVSGLRRLRAAVEEEARRTQRASLETVKDTSREVQQAIRKDVDRIFARTGGGQIARRRKRPQRVSKAVRRKVYDNGRSGAAALIFSKFGRKRGGRFVDYLWPYISGRDIRPRRARMLAIPLQPGRKARDPSNFKDLRSVAIGGSVFLVKTTRTRTRFMFLLTPRVKVTKQIHTARIARREARGMANRTARARRQLGGRAVRPAA